MCSRKHNHDNLPDYRVIRSSLKGAEVSLYGLTKCNKPAKHTARRTLTLITKRLNPLLCWYFMLPPTCCSVKQTLLSPKVRAMPHASPGPFGSWLNSTIDAGGSTENGPQCLSSGASAVRVSRKHNPIR